GKLARGGFGKLSQLRHLVVQGHMLKISQDLKLERKKGAALAPRQNCQKARALRNSSLRLFKFLDKDFGIAAALVVFLSPSRRQIFRRALNKAALGLEISKSLRGKRNELLEAQLSRLALDKLD